MKKITAIKNTPVATTLDNQCVTFNKGDQIFVKNIRPSGIKAYSFADMLMASTSGIVSVEIVFRTNHWA